MFSGIVSGVGRIRKLDRSHDCTRLHIEHGQVWRDLKIGDSVSVSGVCLTVVALGADHFEVEFMDVTRDKTNLGRLTQGSVVNLERSLRLGDSIDGHLVYGHVDASLPLREKRAGQGSVHFVFDLPVSSALLTQHGSVAIDGVSLTVAEKNASGFSVALIPHTLQATTLGTCETGSLLNIEYDMLARYVAEQMEAHA